MPLGEMRIILDPCISELYSRNENHSGRSGSVSMRTGAARPALWSRVLVAVVALTAFAAVLAVDSRGRVVAHVDAPTLPDFDPRDLHFTRSGTLLVGSGKKVPELTPRNFTLDVPIQCLGLLGRPLPPGCR